MQKLKKALKSLTKLGASKPSSRVDSRPAQAAKKAVPVKKKSQPVAAAKKPVATKKGPEKIPIKKASAAPVKAAPKGKTAASKVEPKDLKKKVLASAGKASAPPTKGHEKVAPKEQPKKPAAQVPVKKAAAPEKPAAPAAIKAPVVEKAKREAPEAEELESKARARKAKEETAVAETAGEEEEIVLTDAEGRRYCRVKECDQIAMVDSYCRYHYLLFWKNIQVRKKILSEGKLERYIEELTARYPDKYLEMLRKDLRNEKDFMSAIQELEIDEASVDNEYEDEAQSYLEEVRGMGGGETNARDDEDF